MYNERVINLALFSVAVQYICMARGGDQASARHNEHTHALYESR